MSTATIMSKHSLLSLIAKQRRTNTHGYGSNCCRKNCAHVNPANINDINAKIKTKTNENDSKPTDQALLKA